MDNIKNKHHAITQTLDYLGKNPQNAWGVHIRLSKIRFTQSRDNLITISINTLKQTLSNVESNMFTICDDLVILFKASNPSILDKTIATIRHIFSYDPNGEIDSTDQLINWYDLSTSFSYFKNEVVSLMNTEKEALAREKTISEGNKKAKTLTSHILEKLEGILRQADITMFVRKQAVCVVSKDMKPTKIFNEYFVSSGDLSKIIPNVDLLSNKWLFQNLTLTLDQRMLQFLKRNSANSSESHYSINLNVDSVLTPQFYDFQQHVNAKAQGTLLVELSPIDVFADFTTFQAVCDYLHNMKYKIILDGITHETFEYMAKPNLKFDMVKLRWDPVMSYNTAIKERMTELIRGLGVGRTILCRCDSQASIETGQNMGIVLFQGYAVDDLLKNEKKS